MYIYESYSQNKLPIKYKKELSFLSHSTKHMSFLPKYTPFIPLLHLKCPTFVLLSGLKMSYFCPTFCQKCPTFPTFLTCPTAGHPVCPSPSDVAVVFQHNLESYSRSMGKTGVYGGEPEIKAICWSFNARARVHMGGLGHAVLCNEYGGEHGLQVRTTCRQTNIYVTHCVSVRRNSPTHVAADGFFCKTNILG